MLSVLDFESKKTNDENKWKVAYKNWGQEDHFFVSRMIEMNDKRQSRFSIASRADTERFAAIDEFADDSVVLASGVLPGLAHRDRDRFLALCPELKVLYPALHHPSCFGAHSAINATLCKQNICALQDNLKGGCV